MTVFFKAYLIFTAVMSAAAFAAFGLDKNIARLNGKFMFFSIRRIPEKTLIALAFLGGSLGALIGMGLFRHKTRKTKFRLAVPFSLIIWAALGFLIFTQKLSFSW